ncbi:hypothetical protein EDB85DRAFT_2278291 [Lactarius pseudohatsudake]|nr:hypothetical protein EDB85DRAFT_2278291 [Lactarius pseudohatsudake]
MGRNSQLDSTFLNRPCNTQNKPSLPLKTQKRYRRGVPASSQSPQRQCSRPTPCTHDILSAFSEQASVRVSNTKEHYIRTLPKVVDANSMRTTQPEPQPAGRRGSVQVRGGGQAACVRIDSVPRESAQACAVASPPPTMPFRSVGSHQRAIFFLSTALAFSFSFIQPSVTVERRHLPNVGKASLINTPELVRCAQAGAFRGMSAGEMYEESQYVQLERVLWIVDSPGVIFDNDEGMQGQNVVFNSCVTRLNRRRRQPHVRRYTFCALPPFSAPLQRLSAACRRYPPPDTSSIFEGCS